MIIQIIPIRQGLTNLKSISNFGQLVDFFTERITEGEYDGWCECKMNGDECCYYLREIDPQNGTVITAQWPKVTESGDFVRAKVVVPSGFEPEITWTWSQHSERNVERKTWPRPTLPVRWLKTWIDHKWMIGPRGDALLCEMSQVSQAATRGPLLYSPVITNIVQRGVINHQVSLEPHSHQLCLLVTSWPPLTGRTLARTILHSTFGLNTQPNITTQQVDSAVRGRTPPVVALVSSYRLSRLPRL